VEWERLGGGNGVEAGVLEYGVGVCEVCGSAISGCLCVPGVSSVLGGG